MSKEILRSTEEFFKANPISVDHDGVMADTRTLIVNKVNEIFSTNYLATDIRTWDWVYEIAIKHGMDENGARHLNTMLWYRPDFLFRAEPLEGSREFMYWFYERGIDVPVVSSRNPEFYESTMFWYEEKMPFVNRSKIFIRENSEFSEDTYKAFVLSQNIHSRIHFDDSVEQARVILDYTNTFVALLSNSYSLNHRNGLIHLPSVNSLILPNMVRAQYRVIQSMYY